MAPSQVRKVAFLLSLSLVLLLLLCGTTTSSVLSANFITTQHSPSALSVHINSTPLHSGHGHDAGRRPLDHDLWSLHSLSSLLSPFSSSQHESSSTAPASAFRICHNRDDWGLMYLPRRRMHRQPFQLHARALLRYVCFTCVHWLVRALCNVSRFVCAATQKFAEYECPIDKSTTLIVAGAFIFSLLLTRRRSVPVFTHIAKVAAAVCCMWLPSMKGAQLVMFGVALVAWWCQRSSSDPELVWLTVVCFPISRSSSSSVDTPSSSSGVSPAKQSDRQQTSSDPDFVLRVVTPPSGRVVTPPGGSVDTPAKHTGREPDTEDRFTIFAKPASDNGKTKCLDVRSSDTLASVLQQLPVRISNGCICFSLSFKQAVLVCVSVCRIVFCIAC
jgi:hypothetical protein